MSHVRAARLRRLLLAAACAAAPLPAGAQPAELPPTGFPARCAPGEVEVMLLGTYHFEGSGSDATHREAHDVLSPRRQREIEELVARLARWAPEQIAVEWPIGFADSTRARYDRFRAGTLAPSRNEVVQVGFRLAARLGHPAVYPIDYPMTSLGNDSIGALAARRPDLVRAAERLRARLQAEADSEEVWMRGTTIVEHLRATNTDEALHAGNSLGMLGTYLPGGEGDNYGGPRLVARWYERNIYMAHHLTRVLRPGTKRVLVLVGAGHVPPLRAILDEAPQFCPVSPLPLLRE